MQLAVKVVTYQHHNGKHPYTVSEVYSPPNDILYGVYIDGVREQVIWNKHEYIGEIHREDGPAIKCLSGYEEWWVNGKRIQ